MHSRWAHAAVVSCGCLICPVYPDKKGMGLRPRHNNGIIWGCSVSTLAAAYPAITAACAYCHHAQRRQALVAGAGVGCVSTLLFNLAQARALNKRNTGSTSTTVATCEAVGKVAMGCNCVLGCCSICTHVPTHAYRQHARKHTTLNKPTSTLVRSGDRYWGIWLKVL